MYGEVYGGRLTLENLPRSSDIVHDSTAPEEEAEASTLARL